MAADRLHHFTLLTAAEIENTPSRRDGVSAAKEARLWKKMGISIFETAKMMLPAMSCGTAAIAMTFCARFFTLRSLTKNSPPLIAAAALMLAGKCNDEPRHLRNIIVEVMKQWYGRHNPNLRGQLPNEEFVANLVSRGQEAELVLMFTLKFDFNVDPLIVEALYKIKQTCLANALETNITFQQFLISSSNDIMQRDAGMVLQFRGEDIALAICQLFFKVSKQQGATTAAALEPPPDPETGAAWYLKYGLTEEIHRQISGRFHKLYANVQKNEGGAADAGAATTAGGAESAGLTDGEALGGGATRSVGGGGGGSVAMSIDAPTSPPEEYNQQQQQQQQQQPALEARIEKPKSTRPAAAGGRRMISMDRTTTVSNASIKPPAKRPCSWDDEPMIQPSAGIAGRVGTGTGNGTTPPVPGGASVPSTSQQDYQQQHFPSVYTNYAPPSLTRRAPAGGGEYYKSYGTSPTGVANGNGGGGSHYHAPGVPAAAPAPASDSEVEEGELEEGEIR